MINDDFRQELIQLILTAIPSARLTHGGREIGMRCRYCPDSINPNSFHFYLNLAYDNTPFYFHCFKCHSRGILSLEILLSWGIYTVNPDLLMKVLNHNKKVLSLEKNKAFKDLIIYKLNNNYINDHLLSQKKLQYINKRLGQQLSYDDLLQNKIVLNLKDLLCSNNIKYITRKPYILDQLSESFIGFISEDNAFLNLRNLRPGKVDKSIDSKYTTYNIFNKFETTRNHYTLPSKVDLCNPNKIKIHIAEGPFDILSVYFNLRKEKFNNIYSAVGGNGYINLCKYFIMIMGLINIEFHIYIDNDVEDYKIYNIKDLCKDFRIPFYLHRNLYPGEKDLGVPIQKIREQIEKIC